MKKIGGEFQTEIRMLIEATNAPQHPPVFMTGYDALRAILQDIKNNRGITTVLLPDYLCMSVYKACRVEEMMIEFYPVTYQLLPDVEKIPDGENKAVLIINYFGIVDLSAVRKMLKKKNLLVIEDLVQSWFTFDKAEAADYRFTGCRKTLPVPEGAFIKSKPALDTLAYATGTCPEFAEQKLKGGLLKAWQEVLDSDNDYLFPLEKAEIIALSDRPICKASLNVQALINQLNMKQIAQQRLDNYHLLAKELNAYHITGDELPKGYVPLFFPVKLPEKIHSDVKMIMKKHNIYLPVHWPAFEGLPEQSMGRWFSTRQLSLIIDQRYDSTAMERQITVFTEALSKL